MTFFNTTKKLFPKILLTMVIVVFGVSLSLPQTSLAPEVAHAQSAFKDKLDVLQDPKPVASPAGRPIDDVAANAAKFDEEAKCSSSWNRLTVKCIIKSGLASISIFLIWLSGQLLTFMAWAFDFSIELSIVGFKSLTELDGFKEGWKTARDITNLFFVFILLYIALSTTLQLPGANFKRMITRVLIAVIFVNFSFLLSTVVIDAGNALTIQFYNAAKPPGGTISTRLITALQMVKATGLVEDANPKCAPVAGSGPVNKPKTCTPAEAVSESLVGSSVLTIITRGFGAVLFILMMCLVLGVAAVLFVYRAIVLMFLVVVSPFAFLFFALPGGGFSKHVDWWKALVNQTLFAPAFLVLLIISLKIIEGGGAATPSGPVSGDVAGHFSQIVFYVIAISMLFGSLKVATELGGGAASKIVSSAQGLGKRAGAGAGRLGRRAGAGAAARTLGSAGYSIAHSSRLRDQAAKSGIRGIIARGGLKAAAATQKSTFGGGKGARSFDTIVDDKQKERKDLHDKLKNVDRGRINRVTGRDYKKALKDMERKDVYQKANKDEKEEMRRQLRAGTYKRVKEEEKGRGEERAGKYRDRVLGQEGILGRFGSTGKASAIARERVGDSDSKLNDLQEKLTKAEEKKANATDDKSKEAAENEISKLNGLMAKELSKINKGSGGSSKDGKATTPEGAAAIARAKAAADSAATGHETIKAEQSERDKVSAQMGLGLNATALRNGIEESRMAKASGKGTLDTVIAGAAGFVGSQLKQRVQANKEGAGRIGRDAKNAVQKVAMPITGTAKLARMGADAVGATDVISEIGSVAKDTFAGMADNIKGLALESAGYSSDTPPTPPTPARTTLPDVWDGAVPNAPSPTPNAGGGGSTGGSDSGGTSTPPPAPSAPAPDPEAAARDAEILKAVKQNREQAERTAAAELLRDRTFNKNEIRRDTNELNATKKAQQALESQLAQLAAKDAALAKQGLGPNSAERQQLAKETKKTTEFLYQERQINQGNN